MFRYYLKLAFRTLWIQKKYSILNCISLVIAFTFVLILSLWIKFELSYDRFQSNVDRIYRLTLEENRPNGYKAHYAWMFSHDWNKQIEPYFSEIEKIGRFVPMRNTAVKFNENKLFTKNVFCTDSALFYVFDVAMTHGSKDDFKKTINSVIISQPVADKLFPAKSPIGEIIQLSGEFDQKMKDYQITGVMQPFPLNSHFHPEILVNSPEKDLSNWCYYYVLLKKGSDYKSIADKFDNFKKIHIKKEDAQFLTFHLQPLTDIHLFSHKDRELETNGDIKTIWLFVLICIGILVISILNYVNLNIASYLKRSDNFTITRNLGAQKIDLVLQLLVENIILGFFVLFICLMLYGPIIEVLRRIENFKIYLFGSASFVFLLSFLLFIIFILTGTYPALFFNSSIKSYISGLKTDKGNISKRFYLSKMMIIIQFSLSVLLIIGAITIKKQNRLAFSNRVTNDCSNIIVIKDLNWEVKPLYQKFKEELLRNSLITDVSATMGDPSFDSKEIFYIKDGDLEPEKKKLALHMQVCDDNFIDFFNLKLIAGENFPKYIPKQTFESYILNKDATRYLGFKSPDEAIGKRLSFKFDIDSILYGGKIVGVVNDFHYATLHNEIKPLVMFQQPIWYWDFMIKINSKNRVQALQFINSSWQKIYPDYPFDFIFLDDIYKQAYTKEITQSRFISLFSVIGLLIACIGLFCLTAYIIESRTKEIGIRKVNGAKIFEILILLNKDFLKWVAIAFVIACPVALYAINKWLESFAYKTDLSWWIFVLAGALTLSIPLLTVSWQSWRAATRNPVEALRYE